MEDVVCASEEKQGLSPITTAIDDHLTYPEDSAVQI